MSAGNGRGQSGSRGRGLGTGRGGLGNGYGGDDSNSGPTAKPNDVKDIVKVPSQLGEGGRIFSAGETKGAPNTSAPATVPYTDVYSDYHRAAEKALDKEKIPPAYRTRVKDYFSSLE